MATRAGNRAARLARLSEAAKLLEPRARAGERDACIQLADAHRRFGRYRDAVEVLRRVASADPALQIRLAEWQHNLGDHEAALEAIRSAPASALGSYWEARTLLALGRTEPAAAALERSSPAAGASPEELARHLQLWIQLGDFGAALDRLAHAPAHDPAFTLAKAELQLWSGDHVGALVSAMDAPASSRAWRIRGAAHWLAGQEAAAETNLERALDASPIDPEALLWRGELTRRRGQLDESLTSTEAGIRASRGYPVAGHVSRLLTVIASQQRDGSMGARLDRDAHHELLTLLEPTLPTGSLDGGIPDDVATVKRLLEHALERFAGNRSPRASYLDDDGRLRPLDTPMHSRFAAREVQERIRLLDGTRVIASLIQLAEERSHEPTVYCHIGEVQLWLGDYADAERWFLRALQDSEQVRWAYVGLCASSMMRGRLDQALEHCERAIDVVPPPGRTLYAYRGEVHRRLGRREAADRDLTTMLSLTPSRISSWINLALLRGDAELLRATHARLLKAAPGLMLDAHGELALPIEQPLDATRHVALFEHILEMMRGNRSSSFVTYFTRDGQLRFVP